MDWIFFENYIMIVLARMLQSNWWIFNADLCNHHYYYCQSLLVSPFKNCRKVKHSINLQIVNHQPTKKSTTSQIHITSIQLLHLI